MDEAGGWSLGINSIARPSIDSSKAGESSRIPSAAATRKLHPHLPVPVLFPRQEKKPFEEANQGGGFTKQGGWAAPISRGKGEHLRRAPSCQGAAPVQAAFLPLTLFLFLVPER